MSFQQLCQSFRTFVFDNIVPILDPFRKFTSIRNAIRSEWTRVATGSVSRRHQTSLFAQLSKSLLESANFDLICPIFNFQNLQAKSLAIEYTFQRKMFPATSWVRMV